MFNPDFYPTPIPVIETMLQGIDITGKTVFEPSAGSGNIVDFCIKAGATVLACENNPDLLKIINAKCKVINPDFLKVERHEISHIDYIIMNPPFSAEEKHILHAWDIAPSGCQIISLFNHDSVMGSWSRTENKLKLKELIEGNGYAENLGKVFSTADRKTDIEIGLLRIFKPVEQGENFESYFDLEERFTENTAQGIMPYNEIQEIVSRYVGAVKLFDETIAATAKMNSIADPINNTSIHFGALKTSSHGTIEHVSKDTFRKDLQKACWRIVFQKFNLRKFVTNSIYEELNRYIEKQQAFPFTMNNIFRMVEMIIGTRNDRMGRVLVQAFDRICSLSADNSTAGEKWKTNSNYKVNRRFIDNWVCEYDKRWPSAHTKIRCGHRDETLDDIIKALCFLTGNNYDEVMTFEYTDDYGNKKTAIIESLYSFMSYRKIPWGEWVDWNIFFRVRGYKKGTMHFEFKDEKVWELFNRRVAEIKGWQLPQKTDKKHKGTEHQKSSAMPEKYSSTAPTPNGSDFIPATIPNNSDSSTAATPVFSKQPWEMTREEYKKSRYKTDVIAEIGRSLRQWRSISEDYSDKLKKGIWKGKINENGVDLELFAENQVTNAQKNIDRLNSGELNETEKEAVIRITTHAHKQSVQQAISQSLPVPAEVIADYPEFQKSEHQNHKTEIPAATAKNSNPSTAATPGGSSTYQKRTLWVA